MKRDWILFGSIILLIALGLTTIYSTVIDQENVLAGGGIVNRQLIFVFIGLAIYFLVSRLDYRYLAHPQILVPVFGLIAVSLILILIFGIEINGAKRWILIGGFQLQVSEFAKLVIILITAWLVTQKSKYNIWKIAIASAIPFLIIFLLIFIEPDASTAIILFGIWFFTLFTALPNQLFNALSIIQMICAGIAVNLAIQGNSMVIIYSVIACVFTAILMIIKKNIKFYIILGTLVLGCFLGLGLRFAWTNILKDYQRTRVETYLNPQKDEMGAGFQVSQAKVAIGSGLLFGKGFGHGTQSKLNFLPEHQTDFVFAAYAEEFGLIGAIVLLALYAFAVFRVFNIANSTKDTFGTLISIGFGIKFLLETSINIGMNLGVIPATGIPLPLLSAGGSMFIVTMLGFGLVQSVYSNRELIDSRDALS